MCVRLNYSASDDEQFQSIVRKYKAGKHKIDIVILLELF